MDAPPLHLFRSGQGSSETASAVNKRLVPRGVFANIVILMATLAEIEAIALSLPESDRAKLAAYLLSTLRKACPEDDDGLGEAIRRSEEMDRDPSVCLSPEEFFKALARPT